MLTFEFVGYVFLWLVFVLLGVAAMRGLRGDERENDWTLEVAFILGTAALYAIWMLTRP